MSSTASPESAAEHDSELLLHVYREMLLIRRFEERVAGEFSAGNIPGVVHLYAGEEGCAVGVCAQLRPSDVITSTPVDLFTPVLFGPQICLVATGRIRNHPVVKSEAVAVEHRIWVNVCIDHRAADGDAGGRLLAALEEGFASLG
jgi:hypothetical protein